MAQRLSIQEDETRPSGWAVVSVEPPPLDEAAPVTLTIARSAQSERPFLGPLGWQSAPHAFSPREVSRAGDALELCFGPDVTRHLVVDMDVTLSLPGTDIRERHFWPEISHGVDVALDTAPEPEAAPPAITTTMSAIPESEPVNTVSLVGQGEDDGALEATPPKPPPRDPRLVFAIAGLISVLLLAAGAFFYMRQPTDGIAAPSPPGFAARYQHYLREGGHAAELAALGQEAIAAGETDIGFKAVTLAADRSSPEARRQLARWYDPLAARDGPLAANAGAAATYYAEAAATGDRTAVDALKALCAAAALPQHMGEDAFASLDRATFCPSEAPQ